MQRHHWLVAAVVATSIAMPAIAEENRVTCSGPQDACQKNIQIWKNFEAGVNRQDAAATAALFADDAVWVLPDATVRSRQAIQQRLSDDFKMGVINEVDTVDEVHVSADMAWVIGHWSAKIAGLNNTTQAMQGRWGSVHIRDGNEWRIRMSAPNVDPTVK
jgi:uncharacterized protein (TIGR02246 family)